MTRQLAIYAGCAVVLGASLAAQVKWVCDPKEQRLYRRDLGVVCWDGITYRRTDPGGIPQYMIDYFDKMRRDVRRAVGEMRQKTAVSSTTEVANPAITIPATRALQAPAPPPPPPLDATLLESVQAGMRGPGLREKLGRPGSALTLTSSDGVLETWTYALTDGRTAQLQLKDGVLTSLQIQDQKKN